MIWVRIRHLPPDAATQIHLSEDPAPWDRTHHLLADIFAALTGKPHPHRPKSKADQQRAEALDAERRRRLARKRRREAAHRRAQERKAPADA